MIRLRGLIFVLSLNITFPGLLVGQPLPAPPKVHLTDITAKPGFFNEPAIAVNSTEPDRLVVAWQVNASAAYSVNGGQTWSIAEGTAPKDFRVSGDVSV